MKTVKEILNYTQEEFNEWVKTISKDSFNNIEEGKPFEVLAIVSPDSDDCSFSLIGKFETLGQLHSSLKEKIKGDDIYISNLDSLEFVIFTKVEQLYTHKKLLELMSAIIPQTNKRLS